MNWICLNGKFFSEDVPVLKSANRSFRYGDALFETMKMSDGEVFFWKYHYERLFAGLQVLKFEIPDFFKEKKLEKEIKTLCKKNECENLTKIRLTVFRGNGNLYDFSNELQYLIECSPLEKKANSLNQEGLRIDIFPDSKKSVDKFSNLKSANYLPFVMAALYAKENKLDDCLVLNANGRVCESTIANIFWIKDDIIHTPLLSEGCVAGVMRKFLIERLHDSRYSVQERSLFISDLENADEVFLANAVNGIRWVKQFRQTFFLNVQIKKIYEKSLANL